MNRRLSCAAIKNCRHRTSGIGVIRVEFVRPFAAGGNEIGTRPLAHEEMLHDLARNHT